MRRIPFSKVPNSLLSAFGRWFPASAGVWQTFIAVGAITGLELAGIVHDDHGFWLLFWLTVYSAVTQPVLGYVNRLDNSAETARANAAVKEMRELMSQMRELMVNIQAQENEELEILRARVQEIDDNAQEATP